MYPINTVLTYYHTMFLSFSKKSEKKKKKKKHVVNKIST